MSKKTRWYWLIVGRDGQSEIFQRAYPGSRYSESKVEALLKALAGKAGLTLDEICEAYGPGRRRTQLLQVHKSFQPLILTCGQNPYFSAQMLEVGDPRLVGLIEANPPLWRR